MFGFLDRLPVVKLLQVVAVLNLVFGVIAAIISTYNMMNNAPNYGLINASVTTSMLIKILYQPAVLFGLAEIIKVLQQGKK